MWSQVTTFMSTLFSGVISIFSSLYSNELLHHAYRWLYTGFIIYCCTRFLLIPIFGYATSPLEFIRKPSEFPDWRANTTAVTVSKNHFRGKSSTSTAIRRSE